MKKYLMFSLALAYLAVVFVCAAPAQTVSSALSRQLEIWKTFAPAGKNFQISMPADPQELGEAETAQIVAGMEAQISKSGQDLKSSFLKDVTVYNLDTRWNGFGIMTFPYKWQKIDYDEKTDVLTLSSETVSDDFHLSEWIKFEKARMMPNGTFTSEMNFFFAGKNIKARAVVVKNRVYLLFVGTPDLQSATPALARVYQAEADKFFNSFQILDNKLQIARGSGELKNKN